MRERREALGLRLVDVAEMTGLDPATVSRYERGFEVRPSVRRLVAAVLDRPEMFTPPTRSAA